MICRCLNSASIKILVDKCEPQFFSSLVVSTHDVMGRWIDGGPLELFLIPASFPLLV